MPRKTPPAEPSMTDSSGKMLSFRTSIIVEVLLEQYMRVQSDFELRTVDRADAARRMLRLGLITWAAQNPDKLTLSKEEMAYLKKIAAST